LKGILTKSKKNSVELEDEIKKIWAEKTLEYWHFSFIW